MQLESFQGMPLRSLKHLIKPASVRRTGWGLYLSPITMVHIKVPNQDLHNQDCCSSASVTPPGYCQGKRTAQEERACD